MYYRQLIKADLPFVYFEAFDQPSKNHAAVEPHWGMFRPNRRPKLLGWNMMGYRRFSSLAEYDGWIRGCPGAHADGCSLDSAGVSFMVGFDHRPQDYRGFLAFSTAGLPEDALITDIRLKIRSPGVEGRDPLSGHGELLVEICSPYYGMDWKLQLGDYGAGLNCSAAGAIRGTPREGWYSVEFLPGAADMINLTGTTQFRLSVIGEPSARRSYVKFYSGNADEKNRPVLVIRYDLP